MTDKEKLIWSAGLLEGEGYFGLKSQKIGTVKGNIIISCNMTDRDVLLKLQSYVNCGNVSRAYKNGKVEQNHKDRYVFSISGQKAYNLMKAILPYMGERRKEKINYLIKLYENFKPKIEYIFEEISTGKIEKFHSISKWAKEKKTSNANVSRVANGLRTTCKGWKLLEKITN